MMMEIDKIHQYFNRFHALVLGLKVTLIASAAHCITIKITLDLCMGINSIRNSYDLGPLAKILKTHCEITLFEIFIFCPKNQL